MTAALMRGPELQLPWSATEADDARFKRFVRNGLIALCLVAIIVPFMPVKEISREKKEALPPQLAQVIMEKKELPPPPPPPPKPKKPEPKKEQPKTKPKELPKEKPQLKTKVVDEVKKAREQAQVSGLLAFQDDLMDMRDSLDVQNLNNTPVSSGEQSAAKVERSVITGKAAQGSGGIATAKLSRNTGGAALSGRETTKVDNADAVAVSEQAQAGAVQASGRSDESIRRVMDKNKSRIFSIYNRALRSDPSLQGRFVFEMVIAPSGQITAIKLVSSELGDDALNKKILSRLRLINFGAEKVLATTVNYSLDFVPY
ncbi:AgmX/PglI C-terminal domain-containing protein [Dasania sp. GY-MA-18]|uniref:AgmX/PglI C-terminal domain-containing protein n=1 Tax=Dasania phycosphaerae TaxID=2950436 RepID=A0A9J6RKS3_9GAMM|nr:MULTISPECIES: AgmX/PglI C-terminal domain-containing protein [Dasania]MCR8922363.1 AgmX/PglI C-terminal domain-containing protein [Dasania sp. GY-MA-18]MCZ0864791.1 AgmX/PglI C-terminal domain-containing protein [Dasania phycosphaerae]MCZ0868519.1 AgmX/PglI C-terminal domain-containing protein [Dasania phycosphaerae]